MTSGLSARALTALGDPNRRAIVELLSVRPRAVGEIAAEMPISRPAVSRHLRLLRQADLVDVSTNGTRRIYGLKADGVAAVAAYFADVWSEAAARFKLAAENLDER